MTELIRWIAAPVLAALSTFALPAWAGSCAELAHPRSVADSEGCLAVVPVSDTPGPQRVVVALLHGDGRGSMESRQVERWTGIGQSLTAPGRVVVFLVRPGYRSPAGDSSGWANPNDDDYTPKNIDRVAEALRNLRKAYQADKVVLVATGAQDDNTLPVFGQRWADAASARGVAAKFESVPGRDHGSIQAWPQINRRVTEVLEALP